MGTEEHGETSVETVVGRAVGAEVANYAGDITDLHILLPVQGKIFNWHCSLDRQRFEKVFLRPIVEYKALVVLSNSMHLN